MGEIRGIICRGCSSRCLVRKGEREDPRLRIGDRRGGEDSPKAADWIVAIGQKDWTVMTAKTLRDNYLGWFITFLWPSNSASLSLVSLCLPSTQCPPRLERLTSREGPRQTCRIELKEALGVFRTADNLKSAHDRWLPLKVGWSGCQQRARGSLAYPENDRGLLEMRMMATVDDLKKESNANSSLENALSVAVDG